MSDNKIEQDMLTLIEQIENLSEADLFPDGSLSIIGSSKKNKKKVKEATPAIHPPWKVDKVAKPTATITRANGKRVLATSVLKRGKADPDYEKAKQAVASAKTSRPRRHWVKKESAPTGKGWEKTVKGMKKHPEIDNPFALAHWMKKKGYKPKQEAADPNGDGSVSADELQARIDVKRAQQKAVKPDSKLAQELPQQISRLEKQRQRKSIPENKKKTTSSS